MKLLWLLLVAVSALSNAESILENVSGKDGNKSVFSKKIKPSYVITGIRNSSIFPNMPDRRKKFVVNLNPTVKTESRTAKSPISGNRLMKKLAIKYDNYNGNAKIRTEITTRRTLMHRMTFTVKPHDVHIESIRENHNWNSNRKINTNNSKKREDKKNITEKSIKLSNEEDSMEDRFVNFKNVDINDKDLNELGSQRNKNRYVAAASQKLKTVLLFPKRNNRQHIKVNSEQGASKQGEEIKSGSNIKMTDDEKNQNSDDKIINEKLNISLSPTVFAKSDSKDLKGEIKHIEHFTDKDQFIFVKGVNNNILIEKPTVVPDNDEISTDSNFDVLV